MPNKYINHQTNLKQYQDFNSTGTNTAWDIFGEKSNFNLNMGEENLGLYGSIQEVKRLKIPISIFCFH